MNNLIFHQASPNAIIIFLHLLKTGGTSFNFLLEKNYGDKYKHVEDPEIEFRKLVLRDQYNNYKAISGHFSINDVAYKGIKSFFNHITILRDPIERIISAYYYAQKTEENPFRGEALATSLIDLFKTGRAAPLGLDNYQIRLLSEVYSWRNLKEAQNLALHHLEHDFTFFGFTDRLNEFVLLCEDKFKWEFLDIKKLNANFGKPKQEVLKPTELQLIIDKNQPEIEFYCAAKNLYEEKYRERIDYLTCNNKGVNTSYGYNI